jgi:hypothetical protein
MYNGMWSKEMTEFLPFDKKVKLYVFKDEDEVQISFLINEHTTMNKTFTVKEMDHIIDNWRDPGVSGYETEHSGRIWWEYRNCGPRPDCEPAEFVAISLQSWNFRLSIDEMHELWDTFEYQKRNKNHWD